MRKSLVAVIKVMIVALPVLSIGAIGFAKSQDKPKASVDAQAFDKLKKLAGDWYGKDPATGKEKLALRYRVMSGGSAVEEIIVPGAAYEMTSIYHLDNGSLVMTHYCSAGNQPHLKLTKESTPTKLEFECTGGGGNMKSENDMHIHHVVFDLTSTDKFKSVWSSNTNGKKDKGEQPFDVHRKAK